MTLCTVMHTCCVCGLVHGRQCENTHLWHAEKSVGLLEEHGWPVCCLCCHGLERRHVRHLGLDIDVGRHGGLSGCRVCEAATALRWRRCLYSGVRLLRQTSFSLLCKFTAAPTETTYRPPSDDACFETKVDRTRVWCVVCVCVL